MQTKPLYRYIRPDGGTTISTTKPDGEYTTVFRLIADPGMILSHPDHELTTCVDVDSVDGWTEIPDPGDPADTADELMDNLEDAYREGVNSI